MRIVRALLASAALFLAAPVAAVVPQPIALTGLYTVAAGPDNIEANLPSAVYPYNIAWATDRPGGAGYMVSDGTQWTANVGPTGPQGATGATGANGTNGCTILSGTTAPSVGIGVNCDFYVDVVTMRMYGPKLSGVWGTGTSLVGPAGSTGSPGSAATVAVGTVSTLSPGASATVANAGTSSAAVLNFGIPAGATGATGSAGTNGTNGSAATVAVGTVSALTPGSTPTVTNVGTSSAAVLNFGLTTGDTGAAGVNSFGATTTRTLSLATAYQATTNTKPAFVTVNLSSTAALSLSGGTTNTATVVIGSTNAVASGTGTTICSYANTNTGALTVGLALSTVMGSTCSFALPTGWYFAVRQTAGTVSITSAFDQQVG